MAKSANHYLSTAASTIEDRAAQYDQPGGERAMSAAVQAFNTVSGRQLSPERALSESEGWLFMQLLKDVRQWQTPTRFHEDSAIDAVAYAALKAESLAREGDQ